MNKMNKISPPTQSPLNMDDELDLGFSQASMARFDGASLKQVEIDIQDFPRTVENSEIGESNADLHVMPFDKSKGSVML